tara:strand:- start:10284 stop:11627 length:1344 start_codon:yes stop_codon:yes gene_type:complete
VKTESSVTFATLGLSDKIIKSVEDAGYLHPTPIQEKSIPYVLMGRDVLGGAQTGTGKTASYALPIIDILDSSSSKARMPRALLLAPTRELAQQIANNFSVYSKRHSLKYVILIGGESMGDQEKALDTNPDILIATPGRLLDLFERGMLILSGVKVLVIDEADRMLDMGFIPDIERIANLLPRIRQTLLFSATLGKEIRLLANQFLINPREVRVAPSATIAITVEHIMLGAEQKKKRHVLSSLIKSENYQNAIVFCNRKKDIASIVSDLKKLQLSVGELHGDMHQYKRTNTLQDFKDGKLKILVSSDVAGRGLDIDKVSHVFNYDVPIHAEDYVHRIGRTGRAGRTGKAITLVTPDDEKFVDSIRKLTGQSLQVKSFSRKIMHETKNLDLSVKKKINHDNSLSQLENGNKKNINSNIDSSSSSGGGSKNTRSGKIIGMGNHIPDFLKD